MENDHIRNELLAEELSSRLDDPDNKGFYYTLATTESHEMLRSVLAWVSDYPNPSHKGRLFTWRFKQLKAKKEVPKEEDYIDKKNLQRIEGLKRKMRGKFDNKWE